MNGSQMREIRRKLKMERAEFARLIGYTGTDRNNEMRVKRLENNGPGSPVPLYIARLVWLIDVVLEARVPFTAPRFKNGMIDWPDWPGYDFDHSPDPHHQRKEEVDGPD